MYVYGFAGAFQSSGFRFAQVESAHLKMHAPTGSHAGDGFKNLPADFMIAFYALLPKNFLVNNTGY